MKNLIFILALSLISNIFAAGAIDTKKSEFKWKGTKVSGAHFGTIPLKSADINRNKKNGKITKATLVMDLNKLTVTDLSGKWAQKFLSHIKSGDFFEVGKYPTATLNINKDDGKMLHGDLTIKGKKNPVKIPYKKTKNTYTGALKFDRTKYGMKYGSGSFFKDLGDRMIHDEVTIDFNVVLK